jgi:hypothetical protein
LIFRFFLQNSIFGETWQAKASSNIGCQAVLFTFAALSSIIEEE